MVGSLHCSWIPPRMFLSLIAASSRVIMVVSPSNLGLGSCRSRRPREDDEIQLKYVLLYRAPLPERERLAAVALKWALRDLNMEKVGN